MDTAVSGVPTLRKTAPLVGKLRYPLFESLALLLADRSIGNRIRPVLSVLGGLKKVILSGLAGAAAQQGGGRKGKYRSPGNLAKRRAYMVRTGQWKKKERDM